MQRQKTIWQGSLLEDKNTQSDRAPAPATATAAAQRRAHRACDSVTGRGVHLSRSAQPASVSCGRNLACHIVVCVGGCAITMSQAGVYTPVAELAMVQCRVPIMRWQGCTPQLQSVMNLARTLSLAGVQMSGELRRLQNAGDSTHIVPGCLGQRCLCASQPTAASGGRPNQYRFGYMYALLQLSICPCDLEIHSELNRCSWL